MRISFIDCFPPEDTTAKPLADCLTKAAADDSNLELVSAGASNAEDLKKILVEHIAENPDVIIIGGHASQTGLKVAADSMRWHDFALLLRGKFAPDCTFIFYSCDAGFTELQDIFDRDKAGPDFAFGPIKKIDAAIMADAVIAIIDRKKNGWLSRATAVAIVDSCNSIGGDVLGVMWSSRTQVKRVSPA